MMIMMMRSPHRNRLVMASLALLALGAPLADDLLAAAIDTTPDELATAMRELREAGLLDHTAERLVPLVAEAVTGDLDPGERRRAHDTLARAMLARGDTATAARAVSDVLDAVPEVGVPHDGPEVCAVLERLASGSPAPGV